MTYMVNNRIHVTPGYEEEFEVVIRADTAKASPAS
ncbi:hypothetical protein SAMN05216571_101468 [Onishia taeanensis]|uniref:Uncharacterized protein n=1 Tax=Onishia taeanensis TaxID=284577 RepID=A0A1G7NKX8_9GAMM|nr:hypothetical protein SAMN05216571_101468 [Halomonas taeanensis]